VRRALLLRVSKAAVDHMERSMLES
jgi:hypothetical protein